jgi:hypothetical protein
MSCGLGKSNHLDAWNILLGLEGVAAHHDDEIYNLRSRSLSLLIFKQYSYPRYSSPACFLLPQSFIIYLYSVTRFIMFKLHTFSLAVSGLAAVAQAIDLKDLPPPPKAGTLGRRDDYGPEYSCLDLQSEETFVWGGMSTVRPTVHPC